jgi:membrane protease YdiL (CAAX protease family)
MSSRYSWRRIGTFLAFTALFSSVFYALIIATGHAGGARGGYAVGLMWCPGLAALLTARLFGMPLSSFGWGWGNGRWEIASYLIPFGYVSVAYCLVWLLGFGGFPDPDYIAWARKSLGWVSASGTLVLCGEFAVVATTGLATAMAHALGEEIGWRGFLAPQMDAAFGFTAGALLTGVIWAAWHLPILVFADYNAGTPWRYGFGCFFTMVIAISVIMAWLRLRSGSLWTGVVFHASHNLFIQSFFTPATAPKGNITAYAVDEFGFAVPVAAVASAILVLVLHRRLRTA